MIMVVTGVNSIRGFLTRGKVLVEKKTDSLVVPKVNVDDFIARDKV